MRIALVDINSKNNLVVNKDLSGGFGTTSNYGSSFFSKILINIKKNSVKIPILMFGYLARIFEDNGHEVEFIDKNKITNSDLYIIYTSLIEHNAEINFAIKIKKETKAKICFVGPFATFKPELFLEYADFVIAGEPEQACMKITDNYMYKGLVFSKKVEDLDTLSYPNWKPFDIYSFRYSHYMTSKKTFTTMITSRGCPYSCSYYCPYPEFQGKKFRKRSVINVLDEIDYLKSEYNVESILFRDPIYSLDMERARKISEGMIERKLNINWVCETHLDRLNHELIDIMSASGLKGINVGIESSDKEILNNIGRKSSKISHQEEIIEYAENSGIKIGAFYILGTEYDNKETIMRTVEYAKKLNTTYAQFTLSTPYPGTEFYNDISNRIIEKDWEKYDIYTPTFSHDNLSGTELKKILEKAYSSYYLRYKWLGKYFRFNHS